MDPSSIVISSSRNKKNPSSNDTISLTQLGFAAKTSHKNDVSFKDIQPHPKGVLNVKIMKRSE